GDSHSQGEDYQQRKAESQKKQHIDRHFNSQKTGKQAGDSRKKVQNKNSCSQKYPGQSIFQVQFVFPDQVCQKKETDQDNHSNDDLKFEIHRHSFLSGGSTQ